MRNLTDKEWVEEYYKEAERLAGMAKIILRTFDYYKRKELAEVYKAEYEKWSLRFAGKEPCPYGINALGREYRIKHYGDNYHKPKVYPATHFMNGDEEEKYWHKFIAIHAYR